MPKVPDVGSLSRIPVERGPVVFDRAARGDTTAVGRALQRSGQQLASASDDLTRAILAEQNRRNKRKAKEYETDFRNGLRQLEYGSDDGNEPGYYSLEGGAAVEQHADFVARVNKLKQETLGKATNEQLADYLSPSVESATSDTMRRMASFNLQEERRAELTAHESRLDSFVQDAAKNWNDPQAIIKAKQGGIQEIVDYMNGRTPEEQAAATEVFLAALNQEVIREQIFAKDYDTARETLKRSNKQLPRATSRALAREIDRNEKADKAERERELNKQRREAKAGLDRRLRDNLASIADSGKPLNNFTMSELSFVYGEEEAQQILDQIDAEMDFYVITQELQTTSPDEDKVLLESMTPSGEDYADEVRRRDLVKKALQGKYSALQEDPAAYVEQFMPSVSEAYETAGDDPAAIQTAVEASLQAQADLGVPEWGRRSVSKRRAAIMIGSATSLPDAQAQADWVRAQADLHGDLWPQVSGDLVRDGLPGGMTVIASMTSPGQNKGAVHLAEAQDIGYKELKKVVGDDDTDTVEEAVKTALEPFYDSLAQVPGGQRVYNQYAENAVLSAMLYTSRGDDPGDAAEKAAADIINNKYDFFGTFRVPKEYATNNIVRRIEGYKETGINDLTLVPPAADPLLGAADLQQQYAASIANDGYWVTNSNETGVLLLDSSGREVKQYLPPEFLSDEQLAPLNLTKSERRIVDYHRNTIETGNVGFDYNGAPITVYGLGIEIREGKYKGKFAAVPGYVEGRVLNEDQAYEYWKKEINSGKWPLYDSGDELNLRAEEIHEVMNAESGSFAPVELKFNEVENLPVPLGNRGGPPPEGRAF